MPFHLVRQDLLLCLISVLKQFLNNVIAKDISHQLKTVWLNLTEHLFFLIAVGSLQLLLDEPGPVLVATEFNHVVVNVL